MSMWEQKKAHLLEDANLGAESLGQHQLFQVRGHENPQMPRGVGFSSFLMVRLESVASVPLSDSLIKNAGVAKHG